MHYPRGAQKQISFVLKGLKKQINFTCVRPSHESAKLNPTRGLNYFPILTLPVKRENGVIIQHSRHFIALPGGSLLSHDTCPCVTERSSMVWILGAAEGRASSCSQLWSVGIREGKELRLLLQGRRQEWSVCSSCCPQIVSVLLEGPFSALTKTEFWGLWHSQTEMDQEIKDSIKQQKTRLLEQSITKM